MKDKSISFLLGIGFLLLVNCNINYGEDGYRLWLRYDMIEDEDILDKYASSINQVILNGNSTTISAIKEELEIGLRGLLGKEIIFAEQTDKEGLLVLGTPENSSEIASLNIEDKLEQLGNEGFLIFTTQLSNKKAIIIAANSDIGLLYASYHFLQMLQTHQSIEKISIVSTPKIQHRLLNHWDNLDRKVERLCPCKCFHRNKWYSYNQCKCKCAGTNYRIP